MTPASRTTTTCPQRSTSRRGREGRFHRPGAKLSLPVYLDDQVQATLSALATAKGIELSTLVNDLLRKDIELIELGR